jgi:hypothetical protein
MKEILDRRKGLALATSHKPVDFLDEPPPGSGGAEGGEGEEGGQALSPTPDAAALRRCPPRAVLAWLREVARTLQEGAAVAAAAAAEEGQEEGDGGEEVSG